MKREELINKLERLDYPEIDPKYHKQHLKIRLNSFAISQKGAARDFSSRTHWLKELTMGKKIIMSTITLAILVVLIVAGVMAGGINKSATVSAQELVDQAKKQVDTLSLAEVQRIESQIEITLKTWLEKAENSPDLTVLDKSTVEQILGKQPWNMVAIADTAGETPNGEALRYLRFTDEGVTYIFGLNAKNLPVWYAHN